MRFTHCFQSPRIDHRFDTQIDPIHSIFVTGEALLFFYRLYFVNRLCLAPMHTAVLCANLISYPF